MSEATVSAPINIGRLSTVFRGFARKMAQYRTYRNTLTELQRLGEHELTDLGMNRSALRSVAYKSAYDV